MQYLCLLGHFYPRPPGGGRRKSWRHRLEVAQFLSTPSGWRATVGVETLPPDKLISIHALRVEGDTTSDCGKDDITDFYPRPPGGGRHDHCKLPG